MARLSTPELRRYLLDGRLLSPHCLRATSTPTLAAASYQASCQASQTREYSRLATQLRPCRPTASLRPIVDRQSHTIAPLRKQLKEEAKAAKVAGKKKKKNVDNQTVPGWELTVGIEIHAQLNTDRKLFSPAATPSLADRDSPNSHVALFDVAMPGSQPLFQKATLVPAVRAALALDCAIQPVSRFDRKHYFHWDQPAGYQLTQFYEPFARDGHITLLPRDGIAAEDGEAVTVGIKQVQMEQDTAKTLAQPGEGGVHWLDFNRVGMPLIEIITLPDIHHPATAAALVRKVQLLLNAVDACVLGMESGGLRADVNVSVRRSDDPARKLGQRTEIKNLSSFKAVEDAIIAERDRQIAVLEAGGVVEGETRGWSLGSTETRRLRGKEGEVDYRYMPDPDLGPVAIGQDLLDHLRNTMGVLPDQEVDMLTEQYGLSAKDAMSLMLQDDGGRIQYFYNVLDVLKTQASLVRGGASADTGADAHAHGLVLLAANWCLHELGRLTTARESETLGRTAAPDSLDMTPDGHCRVPAAHLAAIVSHLHHGRITANVAKELLWATFRGEIPVSKGFGDVTDAVETSGLWFNELSEVEYRELAEAAVAGEEKILRQFERFEAGQGSAGFPQGKLMFLVGKMMRNGPAEQMDPKSAEKIMLGVIGDMIGAGSASANG